MTAAPAHQITTIFTPPTGGDVFVDVICSCGRTIRLDPSTALRAAPEVIGALALACLQDDTARRVTTRLSTLTP